MPGTAGLLRSDRPIQRPPARSLRWWTPDVLLTVLVVPTPLPYLHRAGLPLTGSVIAVALAEAAPLLARRIWPAAVLTIVVVINGLAVLLNPDTAPSLAVLVALYTVAVRCPLRTALIAGGVLEGCGIAFVVRDQQGGWWYSAIFLTGMVAAALALGLYVATRQQYLHELHERTRRLELERDQQAALAAAAERTRIAREIHDIVAHHLTVIVTLGDALIAAPGTSPERTAHVLRAVSATGRQALGDTRRLLGVLRDDSEPPAGPGDANPSPMPDLTGLDDVICRVRAAGVQVVYEVTGAAPELPNGVQLTIYRLVQESLTNTLKHAGVGASATVRISYLPDAVQITVRDDGAGTPGTPPSGPGGRGLIGMRERVQAFDGELACGPAAGGGWSTSARLPLDPGDR